MDAPPPKKHARDFLQGNRARVFPRIVDEISTCGNRLLMNFSHEAKSLNNRDNSAENFF
jgi:hypothetical protein